MADFSSSEFLEKLTQISKDAGCRVIKTAIILYLLLKESNTPAWAKVSITAALVYFISPIDAIPDFLPGGYLDDLALLSALLAQLEFFVSSRISEEAERMLPEYCRRK